MVSGNQIGVDCSDEFAKESLRPITSDRVPESPADDDSNLTHGTLRTAREQIETLRRGATPVTFHLFNIATDS